MKKILIVDDEKDFCALIQSYLKPPIYEVQVAFTLDEGIKKINDFRPEVIFIDSKLPDGDGWGVLDYILRYLPSSKINLMSAYRNKPKNIDNSDRVKFLEKPISLEHFRQFL